MTRLLETAFSALPPDLEQVATTLGAGARQAFLLSFDETVISLFLTGPRLTTLTVALFHDAESRVDPLLAVVLIALALCAVLLVDRTVGFTRVIGKE